MPGRKRKTPSALMPPLKRADLEAKRDFARLVARTLIATRDLMNAHFLAEPVYREDGKLRNFRILRMPRGSTTSSFTIRVSNWASGRRMTLSSRSTTSRILLARKRPSLMNSRRHCTPPSRPRGSAISARKLPRIGSESRLTIVLR